MAELDQLKVAVAKVIEDYRAEELGPPTPEHVGHWIDQFDEGVRVPILKELHHVFQSTYYSRARVNNFGSILAERYKAMEGRDPREFWQSANFLRLQRLQGNSQEAMLEVLEVHLREKLGLDINQCGSPAGPYIYLDDFSFTGSTSGEDLSGWIREAAPESAKLHVIVMGAHTFGKWWLLERCFPKVLGETGKDIRCQFRRMDPYKNLPSEANVSDVLWPVEIPDVPAGLQLGPDRERGQIEPRTARRQAGRIFSSEGGRQLLEHEFLKVGIRLLEKCKNPTGLMQPLGFNYRWPGFGSMIASHRNCPNNAPLALWWGDDSGASGPLGGWYPLLRRKTRAGRDWGYTDFDWEEGPT